MKYLSAGFLILIILIVAGCESEKENTLNEEMQKRKNQVPNIGNINSSTTDLQNIKVMTEFTPAQQIIRDQVIAVINKNLETTQAEDIDGALETLDTEGPQIFSTKNAMEYVFKNYDLEYHLEKLRFLSITDSEARVAYQQTTRAIRGTGFTNTRTIGIHTVRKSKDEKWRIFKTEYIQTTPIK